MAEIKHIIDNSNEKWYAVVTFYDTVACLSFETKPDEETLQGEVDDALGWEDIKTGIDDLEMMPNDGCFLVDFADYTEEQKQAIKQPLIEFFTKLYKDNEKKFKKRISKDVKSYEKQSKMVFCESCGKMLNKTKPKLFGTEEDGLRNFDYCISCYKSGAFTEDLTMEQMVDKSLKTWAKNLSSDEKYMKERFMTERFPRMKRWKK